MDCQEWEHPHQCDREDPEMPLDEPDQTVEWLSWVILLLAVVGLFTVIPWIWAAAVLGAKALWALASLAVGLVGMVLGAVLKLTLGALGFLLKSKLVWATAAVVAVAAYLTS
ncbi:MAG: hypothetical protein HY815_22830 [Candidatus Riflebacteria bacterium]|nr:hypothetical protein [Candidatus Riflebacteria bacterium]